MSIRDFSIFETLRDGGRIRIRTIRPDDKARLLDGFRHLSRQSIYLRCMRSRRTLTEAELKYLTEVDFVRHVALVVTLPDEPEEPIIGVAQFIRLDDAGAADGADAAFMVADEHQNRGIGTLLLRHLAAIARDLGVSRLEGDVLPENRPMLAVFAHGGFPMAKVACGGVLHVSLQIGPPGAARAARKAGKPTKVGPPAGTPPSGADSGRGRRARLCPGLGRRAGRKQPARHG
jgi:RimJ/RimL family protein N-acetyltransferase